MADDTKPSLIRSALSGIGGFIKGSLTGITIGGLAGAAIGALVGLATGGGGVPLAAAVGAKLGAALFGSIGAMAGTVTDIVRSRNTGAISLAEATQAVKVAVVQGMAIEHERAQHQQPAAGDVAKVAKVSFARGVKVGHEIERAAAQQEAQAQDTKWRDKYAQEQAARAAGSPSQSVH